jgi:hypothetical protein
MKAHWEKVYQRNREDQLGWYEEVPEPSLNLIAECHLEKDSNILIVGAGASTLIDELLARGYSGLMARRGNISIPFGADHRPGLKDRIRLGLFHNLYRQKTHGQDDFHIPGGHIPVGILWPHVG